MENRKYHIYTLSCPIDGSVKYVGCTTNPSVRLSGHIGGSKYSVEISSSRNPKDLWICGLTEMGLKPIMSTVFVTNSIEKASRMEIVFFNKFNDGQLLCKDPTSHRYNNQLGDDTIKLKRFNSYLRELVSSGVILKEDLFNAIYSKSRMSFKNSYHRIDRKLNHYFSDEEIYKIYTHLTPLGIDLPKDLPYKTRRLLGVAS